jgi:hypothetical protein
MPVNKPFWPPYGLSFIHIFSDPPALENIMEACPAIVERNHTGRALTGVAFPAALSSFTLQGSEQIFYVYPRIHGPCAFRRQPRMARQPLLAMLATSLVQIIITLFQSLYIVTGPPLETENCWRFRHFVQKNNSSEEIPGGSSAHTEML